MEKYNSHSFKRHDTGTFIDGEDEIEIIKSELSKDNLVIHDDMVKDGHRVTTVDVEPIEAFPLIFKK